MGRARGRTTCAGASTACSIVSGKLHVTAGSGTCEVTATKAADPNYNAATSAAFPVTIGLADQAITFGTAPTGLVVGATGKAVSATASSDLPVTYGSLTLTTCTVDPTSGALALLAAGDCTITADQAGNANYEAAPQVTRSFLIAQAGSATANQPVEADTEVPGSTMRSITRTPSAGRPGSCLGR